MAQTFNTQKRMTETLPPWNNLINSMDDTWIWKDTKLYHQETLKRASVASQINFFQRFFVKHVYATQNNSRSVKRALKELLTNLDTEDWGLNLGAGSTRLHEQLINIDIHNNSNIDIITEGNSLPFKENCLKLVVAQEVLEHIADPFATINEVYRVLIPGGIFYCQVPFQIGYHPGPHDYWRFSRDAFEYLFQNDQWYIQELDVSLGYGSALYRIAVEFVAVTASVIYDKLYLPAKAFAAISLLPFKLFDPLTQSSSQKDRIPAGYYCIAVKK